MCPKPTFAATLALALMVTAVAGPTFAWPFSGPAKPSTPAASTAGGANAVADPKAAPTRKATPEERAQAERLDPISRVAFWSHETSVDPADIDARVALASAFRASGRFDEAADAANTVLAQHPKFAPALLELARARISQVKGFYAIKPLQELASMDPKDAHPWVLLGVAYEQNEQPELARTAYEQALKLGPDNPSALSNFALFRATHGEPQAAELMLRKAVTVPGAGAAQRQNLALVLGLQGKMAEAEQLIRQDLPPEAADANLAYLRSLNAAPAATRAIAGRSWGAVQASETGAVKSPS